MKTPGATGRSQSQKYTRMWCPLLLCWLFATAAAAGPSVPVQPIKHQITGLFAPERAEDLRTTIKQLPGIKLLSIDFKSAEASFEYDPAKIFPGAKPDQVITQFDNMLRSASNSTFGVKPLRTLPMEKLKWIEIGVEGLDCKACCLGAYEAIYKIEGVEQATASFKEGRVTALIDPEKTDRARLQAALKQRGVYLKSP